MNRNHEYPPAPRRGFTAALLFFAASLVYAQEPILIAYQQNFIRANLADKAGVLEDAATDDRASEFMGPLYQFALNFILQNAELLRNDPDMIALAALASRGAGKSGYTPAVDTLWQVFMTYPDSLIRVEVLGALGVLGKGNTRLTANLNHFLSTQNTLYRSGMPVDYPAFLACIAALGSLGDLSSFPVLFSLVTGYPENISREASRALYAIQGDLKQFLAELIQKNPPAEKLTAFRLAMDAPGFSDTDRGDLAESALGIGLAFIPGSAESSGILSELRYRAVPVLRDLKWSRAAGLAVKHFYQLQADYGTGSVPKERLLEAIECLGAMGNSEAARVLTLQLGYINSRMEGNGDFDESLTVAVIRALGEIGDKAAFDHLLYIAYLAYPEPVQNAAKDALNRLKW
jgi:HEAT repeat protein